MSYYSREQLYSMTDEQFSRVPIERTAIHHEIRRDAARDKVRVRCPQCRRVAAEYGMPKIPLGRDAAGVFVLRGATITNWKDDAGVIHSTHRVKCKCGYDRPYRQERLVAALATDRRDLTLGVDL